MQVNYFNFVCLTSLISSLHVSREHWRPPPSARRGPSLPLVFAFVDAFEHREAGFLGVRHREWLEFGGRAESGDDLAHGLFARRTMRERLGGQGTVQREPAAADLAVTFAQFVFVEGHARSIPICVHFHQQLITPKRPEFHMEPVTPRG